MLINAKVRGIRETSQGTELILKVDEYIKDKILRLTSAGDVLAELRLNDGRTVTNEQRKKYYATVKDIGDFTGNSLEYMHDYFKFIYCYKNKIEKISMSNCSITEARELINLVLEFALVNDIPLREVGLNRTDDIDKYLYLCLMNRKCVLCGKAADIHHVDAIGMGNDRTKVDHTTKRLIALCRTHHTLAHSIGRDSFLERYKVYGIKLDRYALKNLNM